MTDAAPPLPSEELRALADAHGVATEFWDFTGNHRIVSSATIAAVLTALGVPCGTEGEVRDALAEHELGPWRSPLPPSVVVRHGRETDLPVHVPDGATVDVAVRTEDGGTWPLAQKDVWV
ncbi:MAG: 4-alpha-glucanotransferase, partial [Georgenia sp.]